MAFETQWLTGSEVGLGDAILERMEEGAWKGLEGVWDGAFEH